MNIYLRPVARGGHFKLILAGVLITLSARLSNFYSRALEKSMIGTELMDSYENNKNRTSCLLLSDAYCVSWEVN